MLIQGGDWRGGDAHKCHWSVCLCYTNELSLEATTLRNIITWKVKEAHEPILTCKLTREQLEELLSKPSDVPKFSNHTQSTERCVKQFTEAAAAVVGQDRRYRFVRARLHSREGIPVFKTKKQILVTF